MTEQENTTDAPECGRLLKRMRERLGLSVEDVASELHLSPFQIQALEEDAWDRLPGLTYARGYLRSYARLLDLDAEKLLEGTTTEELQIPPAAPAANPPVSDTSETSPARKKSSRSVTWVLLATFAVVAVSAAYLWRTGEFYRLIPDMTSREITVENESDVVVAEPASGDGEAAVSVVQEQPGEPSDEAGNAETEYSPDQSPLPEGWRRIVFQFNERSWVDLRDDRGERLLYRSFQSGRRIEVEGRPPFSVYLGNAGGVSIEYSGKTIDPDTVPGRKHARFTLGEPAN